MTSPRKPVAPSGASTPPSSQDEEGATPEQPKATPPGADFAPEGGAPEGDPAATPTKPVERVGVKTIEDVGR